MKKRAVLYARVSSKDDEVEGGRLEDQINLCRKYAEGKDYQVVAELSEDERGVSGAVLMPPMVEKFLSMAQAYLFDVLVVREVARFSRDSYKFHSITRTLKKCGVAVEFALYDFPPGHTGDLMRSILSDMAQWERSEITWRLMNGRRRKSRNGSVMVHGHPPYGYDLVKKDKMFSIEINEKEAEIVKLVFRWYKGGMSLREIGRELKRLGIPTRGDADRDKSIRKKKGRCEWATSTLGGMLTSPVYAGTWEYSPEKIKVSVPAIVTTEEFQAVKAISDEHKANSPRRLTYNYLVRRRAVCGDCGCKMVGSPVKLREKTYFYYKCAPNMRARLCHNTRTYPAQLVDALTWGWVKSLLGDPEKIRQGGRSYKDEQERQSEPLRKDLELVEGRLAEATQSYRRLMDLYIDGEKSREYLEERKDGLEKTLRELEATRAEKTADLKAQTLTDDQERKIQEFAQRIAQGIEVADKDFAVRREIIEALKVTVKLNFELDQKVMRIKCVLGEGYYVLSPLIYISADAVRKNVCAIVDYIQK